MRSVRDKQGQAWEINPRAVLYAEVIRERTRVGDQKVWYTEYNVFFPSSETGTCSIIVLDEFWYAYLTGGLVWALTYGLRKKWHYERQLEKAEKKWKMDLEEQAAPHERSVD